MFYGRRNMRKLFSIAVVLVLATTLPIHAADDMKAFPPAEKGMVRYVLNLPKRHDETVFKVELIVGKTVQVDQRNNYFFIGRIEEKTIKGWGCCFTG
jgi:ecotin